jgi:hypothetical protein
MLESVSRAVRRYRATLHFLPGREAVNVKIERIAILGVRRLARTREPDDNPVRRSR